MFIETAEEAFEAARQIADLIPARGFGHVQADFAVGSHRGVGRVPQPSDADADPGRKPEYDDDRRCGGQEGEIEQAGHGAVAKSQQLIAGLLEKYGAARASLDQDGRGRRQQQFLAGGAAHPLSMRPSRKRRIHALAALPVRRRGLLGEARRVHRHQVPIPGLRLLRVSRGACAQGSRHAELQRIGIDDGDAGCRRE